jgi:hypothetical protein
MEAGVASLIEAIGAGYFETLQAREIDWWSLKPADQMSAAAELFANCPGLWVIDDVDMVTAEGDREAVRSALRMAQERGVKILLTACAPRIDWVGDAPTLIPQGNMPPDEVQLLGASLSGMTFDQFDELKSVLKIA